MKTIGITAWVSGLCLAGSTGPIYINIIGLAVFFGGSLLLKGRVL